MCYNLINMYHIIANPNAGVKKGAKVIKKLETYLKAENIPYTLYMTEKDEHAIEIATEICENHIDDDVINIVAVGGDGTFNEVINGIVEFEKVNLGLIRAGRGNDFARFARIPKNPVEAFKAIEADHRRKIDIYHINEERYGLNVVGTGFDIEILRRHAKARIFKKGKLGYLMALFGMLPKFKPYKISYSVDDSEPEYQSVFFVAAGNGRSFGGGMKIAPDASVFDGKLNFVVLPMVKKWRIPFLLPSFLSGRYLKKGIAKQHLCREIKVSFTDGSDEMPVNTDGQIINTSFNIKVVPARLNLFCTERFITENMMKDKDDSNYLSQ